MSDKIKVAIKVRRLIDREESEGLVSQWEVKNNSIFQKDSSGKYREPYSFDHVFDPETNNYEVFNTIARPIIDSSVSGFNGTIFAYGQTSSGKTYTMMGKQHEPGIIPQTIQYIFEAVNKVQGREFLLRASYIEIYNEKVNDLLEKGKTGLKLREVEGTTIICGVKEEVVPTPDKIMKLMKRGENIRRIGETNMNERSSRSHTIFRIIIESRVPNEGEDGVVQVSHLNLVDLAGSERLDQTGSKGDRLKEGCCINRSLFMLSHVISQLSEGQDQYVNFRDSKLTRILQSSLGGNAHTAMICAVTPASIEETSSTLGFASRAINVKNKPHINEVLSDAALLKRYARQIAKLQTELEKTRNKNKTYEVEEIESKLQEEQRRNELLQERIDLMKEQLIGSAATDSVAVDKRRALRRRTWCGHASRKSLSFIAPSLQTIDENSADFFKKECLSTTIQELANNTFFETPLEEFELQLMDAERRLSPDSLDTPCKVTFRKDKSRHVTFDDESELIENQSKKTVEIGSQTEALPINFKVTNTEYGTPPHILRERIMYFQKEYDELREFTTLEKQICNPVNYKEATGLEMQNRHLQKSMSDIEKTVLDVNCINSKLHDENKSLKERLAKETEKCNDIACRLQPVETALSQVSQEVVDLTKQLNVAAQRIKDLENERNDFEMTRELSEARLKTRNKELILSLEDAQMKLKELKQDAEDLTRVSASNFDLKKLQDELIILREENVSYIEELKQKNEYLEQLRQENDELKENDLNICLKNVKEELMSLQKSNFLSIEQLKIKDESLELHIKQIEELKSEREQCLKYIEKCHNQMKQQNEKVTNIHTCTSDVNKEQEEEDSMKEKIDCLETLKHQIEEADLKYTDKLQKKDTYLEEQKEQIQDLKERALNTQELCSEKVLNSATENNLMHTELKAKNEYLELLETVTNHNTELIFAEEGIKMLKDQDMWYNQGSSEKDNHCEILKKHTEHWGSVEIARSKYIDELKEKIVIMQKEITLLKQEKSVTIKEIKEKDGYLEILKKQIQNLDSTIEVNSKYIDELKTNNVTVQKENDSLEEKNSLYREQLRQKDICLETMKQQIEELIGEKEANLTCIDELKANTVSLQTEISSLQENNSVYMRRVKEKNDYLETLKETFEDLNSGKEANLKYIDDLKANIVGLQREINSLQENNSMYMRQVWEKDNCLETLKQQLQDLDCQRKANLTCIDELKANIVSLQKEIPSLEEKYSVYGEQLKEKDNYLETLKQEIEELNCAREKHLKDIDEQKANNECLQKEIISLEEKNSVYMEQLKEKDNYLEALKQEIEDMNCARETNLKDMDELKANNECLQKETISLEENNSVYMEQLKEKDNYIETLKQEIEDMNCARETNLKDIDELKANNECLQKEIISLEEKNSLYMEQLKEKDKYLETLKQETEHLNSEREGNLKYIDELKTNVVSLHREINSVEENNSLYMRQVREKDNCLETLKQQLEDLDCQREANLTFIDELKANIVSLQTEMYSLEEKYSMYSEEVKGKGDYLQQLKRHIEEMNSGRETNLKYIDELETNNASLQMQIHSLEERNSGYMEHVKEKHNYLETLKQEFEDLNFAREANLKYIDELKANIASMQTEIHSLADKNSVCGEQLKEKDNYLETLKQEIEERNCAIETNLKDIDELKANNECLQKEIISLVEKNSIYMEQLKERNTYLESVKQEFEDVVYARETNLECGDERQINIRMRKEINSITPYATYREQLKEKDSYIEALKQQIEDMNSENKANLKCIEQLHEKNKYCDSLKYEKEPKSQEYGVLAEEVECCNTHVPSELSVMTGSVSVKSHEIELCRRMMLKEVSYLKPDYDVESLSQSQLTDLLKMLLAFVMEKEMEMFHSLQDQMNEIHTQANEAEKEYANKDRQKDCWIRELEAEIEHLQALVARVEEEKKALEMDDKSHCLALLEQERADLIKKLRQLDSDLVIVQLERNRVESHNKEMARKLEDLQLLLEKKSSQLQEELENQFNKSQKLETLMKEISDLGENNAVLLERLEKTNNDNNLLLKKVEDLQCALMLKNNENLDIVRKLGSLERELKVLSTKNCALEEEVIANKEVHSLLLKEKEHCSEITLNLKKVTEDVENLRVKKLAWDSEKEQLQAKVAAKESELSLERDIRCRLEKDMMTNIQKVKEEKAQLQVSYSHLLQNYEMLKSEVKHSHLISQVHSLNVSDFMSHKSEITVAEPDENLVLKKQLEEKLERQKELSRKNENLATCITGLKVEVNRLCNENESLRESFKVLSEEESRLNALMCIKESEIQGFKRQLEKIIHEKAALLVACKCIQEPTQQREDALGCENKEYSSSVSENGSCTESLRSRRQFIVKVSHRMAEECGTDISEERKLKEQLKVCMEEKAAVSNENERLVTDIRGLQKMLERYCVDNNALEKSLEIVEEEKKRLVSQLSDSHKRLLNVESEVQELKLKTVAMRKDEASQENIGLRFRVKELEAEVEHLQSRKKSLQGSQIVGHNIGKRHALYCPVQSQLAETTSVLKSSVATNTDISGSCQCKELTEKVHELKLTNAQQNNVIGNLKLQIRAEEFPYQQKVKELEERVSFYKSKNMELRRDVRHLNNMIKDSGCDCSRKPKLLQPKHVSVQTDEVKDEEEFLFAGAGGSGIIREDQLMKMRIKIRDLETKTEMLKELCRARRKKILDLEEKLKTALGSQNMTEEENCDSGESKGITKQIRGAGSSQGVGLIQYNKGFSSDDARGQAGNKENFPGRDEALQRPGRNNVRRPLNENFSSTEDVKVPMSD